MIQLSELNNEYSMFHKKKSKKHSKTVIRKSNKLIHQFHISRICQSQSKFH